jgi:hypothetical protein
MAKTKTIRLQEVHGDVPELQATAVPEYEHRSANDVRVALQAQEQRLCALEGQLAKLLSELQKRLGIKL